MKQSVLSSSFRSTITAILIIALLTITVTTSIQPVFAPRSCAGCGDFLKLTAQFERDVGQSILEFAVENHPNNYLEFKQLTAKFKTEVMNTLLSNPPEPDKIPELHKVYTDGALSIFLGGPDTLLGLLDGYSQGVQEVFGFGPR